MSLTFDLGVPDQQRLLVTLYGLATFVRHHESGEVDLYVGQGRIFRVPGSTPWGPAG